MIDLTADLTAWLGTPEVRALLKSIVAEAVRNEVRTALEDELLDVERAAQMLGMSAGALRKAVERGQVPCERIGNRLRFRRMDLLASGASARRIANANATASPRRAALPTARVPRQLAAPPGTSEEASGVAVLRDSPAVVRVAHRRLSSHEPRLITQSHDGAFGSPQQKVLAP